MVSSLRNVPGANRPRRRAVFSRRGDVFAPTRSTRLDLTPSGLRLDRPRPPRLRPSRQIDLGLWALILAALAVGLWLGMRYWSATRVEASISGVDNGAQLMPDDAADLVITLTVPSSDDRFRARVAVDGVAIDDDVEFTGDDMAIRPTQLVALELVETALDEGDHHITVSVPRLFLPDSTFTWTYEVDSVAPELDLPTALDPVDIASPVTVAGEVESDADLYFDGEPLRHDDGRFSVDFDYPPSGPLHFEAVDPAGNSTVVDTVVPVTYPVESRAVHVTPAAWGNDELRAGVMDLIDRDLIDTVELDIKDEAGVVGYPSTVPMANQIGAVRPEFDLAETVELLRDRGIRVIGRLVAFRDPVYAEAAWAAGRHDEVLQTPDGAMLGAYGGFSNYAHPAVRQYNLDLALEAVELGVHDILWDYIRRPEGDPTSMVIPGLEVPSSASVVDFLADTHEELRRRGAYQGASVFGVAAQAGDSIAQDIPSMARVVDYLAPMLYPSHWGPGMYGVPSPINQPYDIVDVSLADFQLVAEGTGVRFMPWLQDFNLHGVPYGPEEVRAQIDAAADLGVPGFLLWNAQVRYTPEALDPIE